MSRCKHCGVTFHGFGDYCPECNKFIKNALQFVPVRYEPRWNELKGEHVLYLLDNISDSIIQNKSRGSELKFVPVEVVPTGMVSGRIIITYDKKFAVCYDFHDVRHAFIWEEYDVQNGVFTGKPWEIETEDCVYSMSAPISIPIECVEEMELPKPINELIMLDVSVFKQE